MDQCNRYAAVPAPEFVHTRENLKDIVILS